MILLAMLWYSVLEFIASTGKLESTFIVGSDLKLTEQNPTKAELTANKTLPSWRFPNLSNTELARASRPDVTLVLPTGSNHTPHVHVQVLPPSNWDFHLIKFNYCHTMMTPGQIPAPKS